MAYITLDCAVDRGAQLRAGPAIADKRLYLIDASDGGAEAAAVTLNKRDAVKLRDDLTRFIDSI